MKNAKKILALLLCAVLLVGASIAGTVAYLTDKDDVVNTFTVGKVYIELHETDEETRENGTTGLDLHLLPGKPVAKDPTVTVNKDSENCYVRMKVTVNDTEALTKAFEGLTYTGVHGTNVPYVVDGMFQLHLLVDGWKAEEWAFTSYNNGIYEFRYVGTENGIVSKSAADTKLPALFESITLPGTMTNELIKSLENVTISVTAEAIQADTFANADAAWAAFTA